MYYATKRQKFLIEQGYAYKIVPDLWKQAIEGRDDSELLYKGETEQKMLLKELLKSGGSEGEGMFFDDEADVALVDDENERRSSKAASSETVEEGSSGRGNPPAIVREEVSLSSLSMFGSSSGGLLGNR